MTLVVTETTPHIVYLALAGQTDFAVPFPVDTATTDLQVNVSGIPSPFNMLGIESDDGFHIGAVLRLLIPALAGDTVEIQRFTQREQKAVYPLAGAFRTALLNRETSRLWMALQDTALQGEQFGDRALLAPPGESFDPLPDASGRANSALYFGPDGQPVLGAEADGVIGFIPTAFGNQLMLAETAAAALAVLGIGTVEFSAWLPAGDGIGDDSAKFLAAAQVAVALGRALHVGAGRYRLKNAIVLSGGPVVIWGDGATVTELVWDGTGTEGIVCNQTSDQHIVIIRDLSLLNGGTGSTAITIDCTAQIDGIGNVMDRVTPRFFIERVVMTGVPATPGDVFATGWDRGVYALASYMGTCRDCTFTGRLLSYVPNVSFVPASAHGFQFSGTSLLTTNGRPCVFLVDNCTVNYSQNGITFEGVEGAFVDHCTIVGVNYGVVWEDSLGRPELVVCNTHINTYNTGVRFTNAQRVSIFGNFITLAGDTPNTGYGIHVRNFAAAGFDWSDVTIFGNNFEAVPPDLMNGIYVETGRKGSIDGNTFFKMATAILLGPAADQWKVGANNIFTTSSVADVLDQGTLNGVAAAARANPGFVRDAHGIETKFGSQVVTLNGSGLGSINFAAPFKSGIMTVVACSGDGAAIPGAVVAVDQASCTLSALAFRVVPNPGAVSCRINWTAMGF